MSPRKEVARLEQIALENIAKNLEYHKNMSEKLADHEKLNLLYEAFQYHFGDALLKILRGEYWPNRPHISELQCLYNVQNTCMGFILNKHNKKASPHCTSCFRRKIPEEVTSHILSTCRAALEVDVHYSFLNEDHFLSALPQLRNVVKLNLSLTACVDRMVSSVWENLGSLQELDLRKCPDISDGCLLYLCRNILSNEGVDLCKENGFCCNLGKKLKVLNVGETGVTEKGMKYALLHLRSLEHFHYTYASFQENQFSRAVRVLTDDCLSVNKHRLILKLRSVACWGDFTTSGRDREGDKVKEIQSVLSVCPNLKDLSLHVSRETLRGLMVSFSGSISTMHIKFCDNQTLPSSEFWDFLLKYSSQIQKLTLSSISGGWFEVRFLIQILTACQNLKEFVISDMFLVHRETTNALLQLPASIPILKELDLSLAIFNSDEINHFLFSMLNRMTNLKTLKINIKLANYIFRNSSRVNVLNNLEKLHVFVTDMWGVSLEHLVKSENCLQEIILKECGYTEGFFIKHKDAARKNNRLLNIECQTFHRRPPYLHWHHSLKGFL